MKEIKVRFDPQDLRRIDQQAAHFGVSRSELIRQQLCADPSRKAHNLTPQGYYELVATARKRTGNSVDPRQVESIVSAVLLALQ